jgi:protein tyrosine/serine phosphatase
MMPILARLSKPSLVTYVALPWDCYSPHDEHFAQFLTLLRQNRGKKVFVHCRDGDDRTGMDIAAYRMAEQAWTAQAAKEEM